MGLLIRGLVWWVEEENVYVSIGDYEAGGSLTWVQHSMMMIWIIKLKNLLLGTAIYMDKTDISSLYRVQILDIVTYRILLATLFKNYILLLYIE